MEKKLYIYPMTDVRVLNTSKLMRASGTSPELPNGPGTQDNAPRRKTEVF